MSRAESIKRCLEIFETITFFSLNQPLGTLLFSVRTYFQNKYIFFSILNRAEVLDVHFAFNIREKRI